MQSHEFPALKTYTATDKKGLPQGPSVNSLCTLRGPLPLYRENTRPRRDSNRFPALEYPPLSANIVILSVSDRKPRLRRHTEVQSGQRAPLR